jgi:DNA-binding transcriptional ArsR family regulator
VILVAEVISRSSIREDREVKPRACALAGIPLYVVVDQFTSPVTVSLFSVPGPDGYSAINSVPVGQKLHIPDPFDVPLDTGSLPLSPDRHARRLGDGFYMASGGMGRAILRLVATDELAAGEIATAFDATRTAISQHLTVPRNARLIAERREGSRRLYRARPEGLVGLRESLDVMWGHLSGAFDKGLGDDIGQAGKRCRGGR